MNVREAVPGDEGGIARNNIAMARETENAVLDGGMTVEGVRSALGDRRKGTYFVIEGGGEIKAQLMITREWSDWRNADFWWIQSVYVVPEARGRGCFRALFEHAGSRAAQEGACGLRLYVSRKNRSAVEVYRKLGMKRAAYDMYELELSGHGSKDGK